MKSALVQPWCAGHTARVLTPLERKSWMVSTAWPYMLLSAKYLEGAVKSPLRVEEKQMGPIPDHDA